jgi:hypothetical protein
VIAATSIGLGLIAVQLRSAVAYALISTLILLAFGAAVVTTSGSALFSLLAEAILCYNLGIGASLAVMAMLMARRQTKQG